jgi:hypothetical protein
MFFEGKVIMRSEENMSFDFFIKVKIKMISVDIAKIRSIVTKSVTCRKCIASMTKTNFKTDGNAEIELAREYFFKPLSKPVISAKMLTENKAIEKANNKMCHESKGKFTKLKKYS